MMERECYVVQDEEMSQSDTESSAYEGAVIEESHAEVPNAIIRLEGQEQFQYDTVTIDENNPVVYMLNDSDIVVRDGTNLIVRNPLVVVEEVDAENLLNDHNYFSSIGTTRTSKYKGPEHTCTYCSKVFHNQANLMRHIRVHTGEKPFTCPTCLKAFSQQSNLWKHERIHTGLKPYDCSYCDKTFSQRANMQKHVSIHFGIKPYSCDECSKSFTQQANLDKHKLLHAGIKPFDCVYCGKSFTQRINLTKHQNSHLGLKPYKCDVCAASFTQQSNLKKHMQVHTNEKNFACQFCGKSYIQKVSLVKHLLNCPAAKQVPPPNEPEIKQEKDQEISDDIEAKITAHTINRDTGILGHLQCDSCKKIFEIEEQFVEHIGNCDADVEVREQHISTAKCVDVLIEKETNSKLILLDNNLVIKLKPPEDSGAISKGENK